MFNINDIVMIKENNHFISRYVGWTGIITTALNQSYTVTFENNDTWMFFDDDLIDVSAYEQI